MAITSDSSITGDESSGPHIPGSPLRTVLVAVKTTNRAQQIELKATIYPCINTFDERSVCVCWYLGQVGEACASWSLNYLSNSVVTGPPIWQQPRLFAARDMWSRAAGRSEGGT